MQLSKATLPFARALRQVGLRYRLRGWERVLRTLFHPDRQRHFAFDIPFNGFTYRAYADNYVDWNALFYGAYEAFELRLLAAFADRREGAIYLDVGANVGHHALFMAAHARIVHAFEPNPELWPMIEEKIAANEIDSLILHRCGLGHKTDHMALNLGPESGEASLLAGASRTSRENNVLVEIVRGDDYFRQKEIDTVDMIKLDIEGFEKYAIDGMSDHLEMWRPLMMIELSEIGTEQFGNFSSFVATFPENYEFYFCHMRPGLTIRASLLLANAEAYGCFAGNVFCVPKEQEDMFMDIAQGTGYKLAPTSPEKSVLSPAS